MSRLERLNGPGWVIGTIDAYGAIEARIVTENVTHTNREKAGHPWRWCIWEQDWCPATEWKLTAEEMFLVEDWLERRGFKID